MTTEHVLLNGLTGTIDCYHCGVSAVLQGRHAIPVEVALKLLRLHLNWHFDCAPSEEGAALKAKREKAREEWVNESDARV
jgi:hypothetical protein